ncbi:hypothetical protein MWU75_18015 [Ornithinimicrobium sp. F0845]|uniref:hypothetical protein n=1 Tax=Ornithinimicrobium sp. F0845 TaxID=2926412 RepID=UPI001FF1440E|nr:hypothetical protein [Ornithinimicrobium sp. F0845]MCK0114042.1 hypothetical protein [Ornithinimicrobium sp. F0845]
MSSALGDVMTVGAAAEMLGVTTAHVQHLGRLGQVNYVARGLLDGTSVRDYHAVRQGRRARGWSSRTAWAAIDLLSGGSPEWLGQAQLSRLRSRLRTMDAEGLVAASRDRARRCRYAGHESALGRIRAGGRAVEIQSVPGFAGRMSTSPLECYVDDALIEELVSRFRLEPDVRGNVVLHAVRSDADGLGARGVSIDLVRSLMDGEILPALDAATSEDPRERGLALEVLAENLRWFVDHG